MPEEPKPDATDMNELMARDPLELSSQDIDVIIAFHRKNFQVVQGGGKPKKAGEAKPIDLKELGLLPKAEPMKRRV